jgi:hypothetical protein
MLGTEQRGFKPEISLPFALYGHGMTTDRIYFTAATHLGSG